MDMIRVENFKKSFGDKTIHEDINFHVTPGECLGLVGGSGAGKSVILKSLIGLIKPDNGNLYINNESIIGLSEEQFIPIRKKVAYVFQNGALFDSMTVFDNLAYPLREHTNLTEEEIEVKVHSVLDEFNLAYNDDLLPSELSGGMQKRVGLARSIILDPDVILYDEPTAGLDPYNTIKIQEMILKLKMRNVTSIFVTHDMPSAMACCDRIILIKKGHIICTQTMEEIKSGALGPIQDFIKGVA